MKKYTLMVSMIVLVCMLFAGIVSGEEAGCLQSTDNWIIRVYSGGSSNPYSFSLAVLDTNGVLVPASSITGLQTLGNPYVFETSGSKPDLSLGCDAKTGTAYILHDHQGVMSLTTLENIAEVFAGTPVLSVNTTLVLFGGVVLGTTKDSTVTVTNTGTGPLHVTSVTSPSAPFTKMTDGCSGATVAPSGTCAIVIRLTPLARVTYTSSFSISSDGGNATVTVKGKGL